MSMQRDPRHDPRKGDRLRDETGRLMMNKELLAPLSAAGGQYE